MAYKVIDDDTALLIYEAVQESAARSFGQYNRLRQLPRTKIDGEIVFYLDALLDFSEKALGREEAETLQEVIDAGVVAWFGNLSPELQKKIGFCLGDSEGDVALSMAGNASDLDANENRDTIEALSKRVETLDVALETSRNEASRLADEVASLKEEKAALRMEVKRLERLNEELLEKSLDDEAPKVSGPAFLGDDNGGSGYTEMTTHLLTPAQSDAMGSKGSKKKSNKKRKKSFGPPHGQ